MGIKDLLKFMKPYVQPIHIQKYAGKRVGIDAYSWLHKGAYSCSMELCLDSDSVKKLNYLKYFMHRINLFRHYRIIPVVVFDGANIPCKAATEEERHRRRKANLDTALAKHKEGDIRAASELFQRSISITPKMAHQLIQILRSENVEYVVAPYEADAQLAYLSSLEAENGGIAAVISEDSDLLAYGCPVTVFKMDRYGNGEEIILDKVFDSEDLVPSFRNFNKELFTEVVVQGNGMCVLAGCDFLQSIHGIGIGKAHSLVSKYRDLDRALHVLRFDKGNQMPEDYLKSFREAVAVFQHARIYDAKNKRLKHLKPIDEKLQQFLEDELDFLGPELPPSVATAIAKGELDPITMEAFNFYAGSTILDHIQGSYEHPIPKAIDLVLSPKESCFTLFPSCKTRDERITAMKQSLNVTETKYVNEAEALKRIMAPLYVHGIPETIKPCNETPSSIPNNNPFKKQKLDNISSDQTESIQVSEVTDVINSDERDCNKIISEQVSVVTEVEKLEAFSEGLSSQGSINSKPKKIKQTKFKRKACKDFNRGNSSILNFFSPK
ncbi:XPG-I domain [Dillenia turbinata]|uniref:Exonuclease 1 n=1 Tax=Dillenia turbinata TaxID=194707 RepID=A0AAN8UXW4_9MAGN